ncbi:hypothetical protein BOX15_Mlig012024g2 [Macrostomum lignano]|uniref:Myosin motor domain-containing protein n=1 Tax=Macrostomum lignano TaxID=282301 RepID=A0A267GE75_9PLAT|nr:hypothetical protein BOX15_Mlig012024g2 [Macrostomum lignano]
MRPSADIYDLASLTELSEEAIGKVLQDRYNGDRIYTLVGDILVFLNPFKPVNVYTEKEFSCLSRPDWSGPVAVGNEVGSRAHIYTVGTAAFNLVGKDSTILISGESGSGKTESTKLLLQQFVKMASSSQLNRTRVAECLLAANPIMEAFGNARTVMNHNSSRFAKFVSLGLQGNALVSSEIRTYMLEKSRLLSATEDEGNFHIFYYMCLSSNSFFKDVRPLGPLSLISNAETLGRRYTDLEAKATEVLDAFDKLGFTAQQKEGVFQILSGLLLLADVEFRSEEQNHTVCTSLDPKSETTFKLACKRLGLKGKDSRRRLLKTLTTSKLKVNDEDIYSLFHEDKTRLVLNGCIRAIYTKLFDWIIQRVNDSLASTGRPDPGTRVRQIGVLDIFGFESLAINSFEQLCINLANEQLQLFFTHHVIQLEQAEYQSEGLSWVEIPFEDNQVTLNLFLERPLGVLSLLNEESSLASGTDESLYNKLMKHLVDKPKLQISAKNPAVFTVNHYAGAVTYTIPGMVDKNRDKAPENTIEVLASSKLKLLTEIISSHHGGKAKAGNGKQQASAGLQLAVQFRSSLDFLLAKLRESQPFFVRCIKPNRDNAANSFDQEYVRRQIHYCGIAEAVRVRQAGFPVRCTYGELHLLCPVLSFLYGSGRLESDAARVRAVCRQAKLPAEEVAMGKTKVFMRVNASRLLAKQERRYCGRVVTCQKVTRGWLQRRRYLKLKAAEVERRKRAALALPITPTAPPPPEELRKSTVSVGEEGEEGAQVTRSETVLWFKTTQKDQIMQTRGYETWFHGIITRNEANQLLGSKNTGSFLVRVSNSQLGFVLSFKSRNGVRHYLIEQLERGRFNVLGEKQVHSSLGKIIDFHKANGFRNCDVRLTTPVGQPDKEPDYEELLCNAPAL